MASLFKNIFGASFKHKKLSEDWVNLQRSVSEGVTFACRDLGSTVVTEAQNETATAEAIRRVIHLVRATHAKPNKVTLHVSSKGVKIRCIETGETVRDTDICDIAYCSADSQYNHVIAFITNGEKNVFDCCAYLCQNSKMAQTVAIAIAHAFNMAYNETWQSEFEDRTSKITEDATSEGIENNLIEIENQNAFSKKETAAATLSSGLVSDISSVRSVGSLNVCNTHCEDPWLHITLDDRRTKSKIESWTSFDDESQVIVLNAVSNLKLDDCEIRCKLPSTKPPQRCKDDESSMEMNPRIIETSSQDRIERSPIQTKHFGERLSENDLFDEFESQWKRKSENVNWETFGNSASSNLISLNLNQSPIATPSNVDSNWTSFAD